VPRNTCSIVVQTSKHSSYYCQKRTKELFCYSFIYLLLNKEILIYFSIISNKLVFLSFSNSEFGESIRAIEKIRSLRIVTDLLLVLCVLISCSLLLVYLKAHKAFSCFSSMATEAVIVEVSRWAAKRHTYY